MKDRIILDLCGGSGSWSKPYREAGYDVRLITLPDHDVRTYRPPAGVHGVLAAPPCEKFSLARGRHETQPWNKRDFDQALEVVDACLKIIWKCRPEWWALENPVGYLNRFLGKPRYCFRACDFGDPWEKRTYLWGFFNEPGRNPVHPTVIWDQARSRDRSRLSGHSVKGRAGSKAVTPPGFARAFFTYNP